jgi:putative acetyltransferase
MLTIRPETLADIAAIRRINERAFDTPAEADVVDELRRICPEFVSLVAEIDATVVGHILFTPVTVDVSPDLVGMGLAPMAVDPDFQLRGIGSALVVTGLETLRAKGCPFVIVLGHPEFYPRFGFELASAHCLTSQWEGVPDEAFMVCVFDAEALDGVSGIARYRDEFDAAM